MSVTKGEKKDFLKFQLLGTVNYIFMKQRTKSVCVMLQNNAS